MSVLAMIAIFLVVLFVLVLVHEWGHYITAKLTGMRVDTFAIGFPPKLWSKKYGETEYVLNSLPIGGYVSILGENGDQDDSISAEDKLRTFSARPRFAQALVLFAGVFMNLFLAWVLVVGITIAGIGSDQPVSEADASPSARLMVAGILPDSPASLVMESGGEVIMMTIGEMVYERPILTPSLFSELVQQNPGALMELALEQAGTVDIISVTPATQVVDGEERSVIGVSLVLVEPVTYGVIGAVSAGSVQFFDLTKRITVGLFDFFGSVFRGTADFAQVAGPVGIVGYVGLAAENGFIALLYFTAVISINLALINLLPIPALDGGRLVFVAIESIIRRPLPAIWTERVNTIGFILLLLLLLVVTVNDVLKLV